MYLTFFVRWLFKPLHLDLMVLNSLLFLIFSETTYLYLRVKHLETDPCSSCLSS